MIINAIIASTEGYSELVCNSFPIIKLDHPVIWFSRIHVIIVSKLIRRLIAQVAF